MTLEEIRDDDSLLVVQEANEKVRHQFYWLAAEVERLRGCLKKANEQAEHFEREWYLRGDEIEKLRTAINQTLDENGHLADGDVCTLILLKRAVEG